VAQGMGVVQSVVLRLDPETMNRVPRRPRQQP
jgi:hypothetical protein